MVSRALDVVAALGQRRSLGDGLRSLALHDWLVFAYLLALNVAVLRGPPGELKQACLTKVGFLFAALLFGLALVRGLPPRPSIFSAVVYRVVIYGTVQLSYFFFRELLPFVNPTSLDTELHGLGLLLFGAEPALVMDRAVTDLSTEWFSFFYFGYFFVLAVHVLPILFLAKDRRVLGEFTFGMLFMFCVGHTLYMLVPGYGPYRAVAAEFARGFPDGLWLDVVMEAVSEGGAQKDIFPSLHTAAPLFIALFSFRHRAVIPFRFTWPVVLFFSANIIVATMFLRWHWVVDVAAGIALATTAQALSVTVNNWELKRRAADERLGPAWPEYSASS